MNVLIIDDDKLVTLSLKTILENESNITVVATGSNGLEAIALYKRYHPDIVLMDIRMVEMNGIEASREIINYDTQAKILLLTTLQDDEYIIEALNLGVKGYLLKQDYNSIIPALHAVNANQSVFVSDVMGRLTNLVSAKSIKNNGILSPKEFEVVECISQGLSNKEIAQKIYLSEGTIRNYISAILTKLELRDRTQIAIFYYTKY